MHCTHLLVSLLGLPALLAAQDAASPPTTLRIVHGDAAAIARAEGADESARLAVGFGWRATATDSRSFVAPLRSDLEPSAPQPAAGRSAANLGDVATPCPVVTVAGVRVACIALAVAGAGGCADWARVEPPAAALARLWPELARRADVALVLADADRIECGEWLREVPLPVVALVRGRGGVDPEPVRLGAACLVQSPCTANVRGELVVSLATGRLAGIENRFVPAPAVHEDGAEDLVRRLVAAEPVAAASASAAAAIAADAAAGLTVRIDVRAARRLRAGGIDLLALDLELTNDTDPRQAMAARRSPRLALLPEHFQLELRPGARSAPDGAASAAPGGLLADGAEHPIVLERPGSARRGELCFVVGEAPLAGAALVFRSAGGEEKRIALPPIDPAAAAAESSAKETAGSAAPAPTPTFAPSGLAAHGITAQQIDAAIARGGAFLWSKVRQSAAPATASHVLNGSSYELLAALALVHANEPGREPECAAWIEELLDHLHPTGRMQTYQAGVLAMLVDAVGSPEHLRLLRMAARFLVESQGPGGTWGYGAQVADDLLVDPDQRVLQVSGGTPLDGSPKSVLACPRLSPPETGADGDNSCTQFALLGLRAAARYDVEIPAPTWRRARLATLRRQLTAGGFGYEGVPSEGVTGAMTAAGICALAITGHALQLGPAGDDPLVQKAVAWLDANFAIDRNPGGGWASYYRYSLERTGRFLDTEMLGRHEWYPLGARHLLQTQSADGSWLEVGSDPVLDTSFALLFLTRATARLREELRTGGSGTLATGIALAAVGRLYLILDASGSMLEPLDGRPKFDIARDAAAALANALPAGTEVALRVYGHTKRSVEPGAESDSALVLPFAPLESTGFARALTSLRAKGRTPLAFSLQEVARDLGAYGGDRTTVVLLTDGGEDARSQLDPIRAAEQLRAVPDLAFHVIGFDIGRPDWRSQLERTAAAAGGRYWPAPRGVDLGTSLRAAVLLLPESWRVLDAAGQEVATGPFGASQTLPEGHYTFVTRFAGQEHAAPFWINTDATTRVLFDGGKATVQ